MITLIGTGHVFDLSNAIIEKLDQIQPDVICVELDRQRYNSLILKKTNPEKYYKARKNSPIIYKVLAKFQDNMAKKYGVNAGDEMLAAINFARSHQIPIQLIDVDAQKIFSKMLKDMTISEKVKLFLSGFAGLFVNTTRVEDELKKVEQEFDAYISQIGEKFPTIKKILIDDRNIYLANNIEKLTENYKKIVACVGDGHVPGISEILKDKNLDLDIIRLSELRNKRKVENTGSDAHFTIEYKSQ